jgi:hypothetical protein
MNAIEVLLVVQTMILFVIAHRLRPANTKGGALVPFFIIIVLGAALYAPLLVPMSNK